MSTLDNVFIRAFSRDSVQSAMPNRDERSAIISETVASMYFIDESSPSGNIYRIDSVWAGQTDLAAPPTQNAAAPQVAPPADDTGDNSPPARTAEAKIVPVIAHEESPTPTPAPAPTPAPSAIDREDATGETQLVRLDRAAAQIPSSHFRLLPHVPDVRGITDGNRRTIKLDPIGPHNKFAPVWEVDQFAWTETAENLSKHAEESLQGAGVYLRGACRDGLRVLAITSSARGEGRTTIAQCLARAVAASGIRVAILDADLENSDLANQLGLEAACGWDEVILGRLPLEEVAIHSLNDRITVIPLTPAVAASNLSLEDPRITALVREAAELFDLLIIDMGPVGSANRQLFESGPHCPVDATIIVRDLRSTPAEPTFTIGARLRSAGVKSVGIVENFVPRSLSASS